MGNAASIPAPSIAIRRPCDEDREDRAAIIRFWFEEVEPARWFAKDAAFDAVIRSCFLETHRAITTGERPHWRDDAEGCLAAILVLDQFSRNLFREMPQAFATDPQARAYSRHAIAHGFDRQAPPVHRLFFYLPFEHSEAAEAAADQETAVRLIAPLGLPDALQWARRHQEIIHRFGRFPHRNGILNRPSTPEEQAFLRLPGSGFHRF